MRRLLSLSLLPLMMAAAPGWKAGAARVSMTPRKSIWMAGFGDRKSASQGVGLELYARALALEDAAGNRAVLVTTEMLGFTSGVAKVVADRVRERYGIPRERLLLNSSHTHCGPVIDHMLSGAYSLTPAQWADIEAYTAELEDEVVDAVGQAVRNLAPARIGFGQTNASFGVNRRKDAGRIWGPEYAGPADHDVPVLRVDGENGRLLAIVFGYGCHPSTLPPSYCKFHGDYSGVAATRLEDQHPGAVALFVMGAGGDVKPFPCDTVALVEAYGQVLAATVERQIGEKLVPVAGPLAATFELLPLPFAPPPSRDEWQAQLKSRTPGVARRAAGMLRVLDRDGRLPADYPDPLQVWQFGGGLTLVAMGGEVLSDYGLRLKKEYAGKRLWVAGYSNDVFAYIPSERVLREGGYEGGQAMIPYMQQGPWAPGIEEKIVGKVHELIARAGGK